MITSGKDGDADNMVSKDKSHGRNWLVGRGGKNARPTSTTPAPTDNYVQELASKIKQEIESEFDAKMNRKVQENNAWILKKLQDSNPELKFDITDFCATMSSDQDDNDTPLTQRGTPVTQSGTPVTQGDASL